MAYGLHANKFNAYVKNKDLKMPRYLAIPKTY
jgi:hypothetical protein